MNFSLLTDDEVKRWLWLRAIEWNALPAFLSQPLAPVLFMFYPRYWVVCAVLLLALAWTLFRYLFVSVALAECACLFVVWLKWPAAIGSGVYLLIHRQFVAGVIALAWPMLAGFVSFPGKVGVTELAFAKEIGFLPSDTQP